ncbi:MAG: restriction endonuclease subunit S [Anaerolineales bacterium]|nr:MAG: restriction endonuclease subunit S [Anaerolineales bacterium]
MSDLPIGWIKTTLSDVASQGQYGWTSKATDKGRVKYLRTTDITSGRINWDTVPYCQDNPPSVEKYKIASGDILISRAGSVGFSVLVQDIPPTSAVFASYLIRYIPKAEVNPKFIAHFLQSPNYWRQISDASAGIALANVNAKKLADVVLPLAPLNEQKRIADKLDSLLTRVDACERRLERVPQILKRFRQSVLAAATSGRLTEGWREEKRIDGEWGYTDVQSVALVGTGSTPLRSNASFYASKGTPWITSAATGDPFINDAKEFVTKEAIKIHRLKLYPIGTVIVAMYGEGKTRGQVSELAIQATINQACAAIIIDETKIEKKYLKLALQANYLEMRELAEGGNQPNLNLTKIKEFTFPFPSLEEQAEIVRRVETLFAFADRLEARYAAGHGLVGRLTPSLLAKAFRGELVEQDPADEPASVLLERIREAREAEQMGPNRKSRKSKPIARKSGVPNIEDK